MANITHEFSKIEMIASIGDFKVNYTLTNHGENSYGLFVESIEWEMFGWYPREWSLDVSTYIGEVKLEEEELPIFDFTETNEKISAFVKATLSDFLGEMNCIVEEATK